MRKKVKSVQLMADRHGGVMKDKYGNYASTITFDDGVSGYYRHKDQNDDYFKVDQEAEFEVEEKSNAQGNK